MTYMTRQLYKYMFNEEINFEDVEATLMLALFGTQALHGESRTKLDARYSIDKARRTCAIDSGTPAGQHLNELFTGYLRQSFGESDFRIDRIVGEVSATGAAPSPA